jgi:hypothetical protein
MASAGEAHFLESYDLSGDDGDFKQQMEERHWNYGETLESTAWIEHAGPTRVPADAPDPREP